MNVRHYLVTVRYFPDSNLHKIYETCDHFSTIRYSLRNLGRIVSSHARSCVENTTVRRLALPVSHIAPQCLNAAFRKTQYTFRKL